MVLGESIEHQFPIAFVGFANPHLIHHPQSARVGGHVRDLRETHHLFYGGDGPGAPAHPEADESPGSDAR
jgi:hypothetical protein